ncbi:MAG: indole-3-glycerol phosphate synthase TrpC, partial [Rickettsiales bacterium]|nr:indole-3-glycerol phosphate synthase TrpC [Rickettsiales bacterium]
MKNILEEIYKHKLIEVRNRKKTLSVKEICQQLKCQKNAVKDFYQALKNKNDKAEISLICEIKKASPSHGIIREDFNHLEIAKAYENAGATCLSILTDEKYFMGKNQYLQEVAAVANLPILRKDFIVDTYQIYEAKMLGASCILLIVAMIDDAKLIELEQCAFDLGLSVLIEIHNEEELQRTAKLRSKLLGINNRDLKTLKVDLQTSLFLSEQVPDDYVLISESGIKDALDIDLLQQAGINCFLIGEHFMRQKNIIKAVKDI